MNKQEIIKKITQKKEFSKLPNKDVEMAFAQFDKERYLDEEKIKLTRDLLRKVFSAFTSHKILNIKDKDPEWILRKHLSTRERLPYYKDVYKKVLEGTGEKVSILDFGAGINGFSYGFFEKKVDYIGVEAIGQLVELMNYYFKTRGLNGWAIHESIFNLEKIKKYIKQVKGEKIVFLFKTLDSLEMLKRDYSKELLSEIVPLVDRVVVSFATRSMIKREKFMVNRKWITDFIKESFKITDDFEIGGERYIVFSK